MTLDAGEYGSAWHLNCSRCNLQVINTADAAISDAEMAAWWNERKPGRPL